MNKLFRCFLDEQRYERVYLGDFQCAKKIKQKLKTHKSTQYIKSFEFGIYCYFSSGDSYKLFIISKEQTKILNFLI